MVREKAKLYVVLDTNVFLAPPNAYHEGKTQDKRPIIQVLQDFHNGDFGHLPPVYVRIPEIVRLELVSISYGTESAYLSWNNNTTELSKSEQALTAVKYLDYVTFNDRTGQGTIAYQNLTEHQEAKQLQVHGKDNDELVLLCCLQTRENYSGNTWLITNDVKLSARAVRSNILSLNLNAFKHAMTLSNSSVGKTFLNIVPDRWIRLQCQPEVTKVCEQDPYELRPSPCGPKEEKSVATEVDSSSGIVHMMVDFLGSIMDLRRNNVERSYVIVAETNVVFLIAASLTGLLGFSDTCL